MSTSIISRQKFRNLEKVSKHKHVPKSWGAERWLVNNDLYCGKILTMAKGYKLSYHYHLIKDETFYIQSGKVKLIYGLHDDLSKPRSEIILERGDTFWVPRTLRHQLICLEDSEIIEFSTHHEDSDSFRVEAGDL
jgi:mannose-6-phosphate isomerase-like protein (cupin superfamily)